MQRVNFLAKEYRLEPVRNEEMIGIYAILGAKDLHIPHLIKILLTNG